MRWNSWAICALLIVAAVAGNSQTAVCPDFDGGAIDDHYSLEDAAKARRFLADLKAAIHQDNKIQIGSMMLYPFLVGSGTGQNTVRREIRNQAQFLAAYPTIITAGVRNSVESQNPECLFAIKEGIMIGNGVVWFRLQPDGKFKIISMVAN